MDTACVTLSAGAVTEYSTFNAEVNQYTLYRILRKLRKVLSDYGDVETSILVVVREQSSILQSLFAFAYTHQRFSTLEKFLNHGIKNHHAEAFGALWYDEIYQNFRDLFREEKLIFLPYELLSEDPVSFVEKAVGHLGNVDLAELTKLASVKPENVNRGEDGFSELRGQSIVLHASRYLSASYKDCVPEKYINLVKKIRYWIERPFRGAIIRGSVKWSDDQQKLIQDLYRDSNTRLSDMISVDLGRLGYSVNKTEPN